MENKCKLALCCSLPGNGSGSSLVLRGISVKCDRPKHLQRATNHSCIAGA